MEAAHGGYGRLNAKKAALEARPFTGGRIGMPKFSRS
jgi:hypothetical protein